VIRAYVYDSGRPSVQVKLEAYREEPRTGDREQTTESSFMFVAVDDDRTPQSLPDLTTETERMELLYWRAGEGRSD